MISKSALNDATGAITTFAVLAVAMGTGEFSLTSSLLDLLKELMIGIAAGATLGYLAALLIAHERWAFLAEYAPVVTVAAVIGAYFPADGVRQRVQAVFVFGIVLETRRFSALNESARRETEEYVTIRHSSSGYSSSSCSARRSISDL